ncbi:FAD-binding oxidoreductase [Streptomyces sp. KL116D]|uniref:FAD-binding oxidoreductase n=1 Tax=Streptomyces sp. KL116D TaxID=3045152 RepID=UPI003558B5D9
MAQAKSVLLRVADVVRETEDAVSIVFEGHPELPAHRPGQYLTLRVPSELTGSVARCYSLASSADRHEPTRVIVRRTASGYASNWLCDNIAAGAEIEVPPPAGVFTPASLDQDLLLLAGGSGITPVLAIAKSVLSTGTGSIELFYANRDAESVIAAAELRDLAARVPGQLSVRHWLEPLHGPPQAEELVRLAEAATGRHAFVCGPGPFMEAVGRPGRRPEAGAQGDPHRGLHLAVRGPVR